MDAFLFTPDAFHALIQTVGGSAVVGLPIRESTEGATADLLARGASELDECGFAEDPRVRGLAEVVAHPRRAVLVARDRTALPRQQWMFYEREGRVVEQTLPARAIHRLVAVDGGERELVDRLVGSLALTDIPGLHGQIIIPQSLFQEVIRLVRAEAQRGVAQDLLLAAEVPASLAENFLEALEHAVFAAVIVFLKLSGPEAIDARELTVIQGSDRCGHFIRSRSVSRSLSSR